MRQFKRENSIVDCFPLLKKRKEKTRSPKPKKMGKLLLLEHNKVPTSGYHQMVEDDDSIVLVISEEGLVELNGIPMVTRENDCGGVNPLGSTGEEEDYKGGFDGPKSFEIQVLRNEGESKHINFGAREEIITVEMVDTKQEESPSWNLISGGQHPSSSFYSHSQLESSKQFDPFGMSNHAECQQIPEQTYTTFQLPAEMTQVERQNEVEVALEQCQQLLNECSRFPDVDFKEPNWWEALLKKTNERKNNRFSYEKRNIKFSVETEPLKYSSLLSQSTNKNTLLSQSTNQNTMHVSDAESFIAAAGSPPGNCGFCVFESNFAPKSSTAHEEDLEFDHLVASRTKASLNSTQTYSNTTMIASEEHGTKLNITEQEINEINRILTGDVEFNSGLCAGTASPTIEFSKLVSTSDDQLLDGHLLDAYLKDKFQSSDLSTFRVSGIGYTALEPTTVESVEEGPLITSPVSKTELNVSEHTIPPDKKHDSKDLPVVCVSMSLLSDSEDLTVEGPPPKNGGGQSNQGEDLLGQTAIDANVHTRHSKFLILKTESIIGNDATDDFSDIDKSALEIKTGSCLDSMVDSVTINNLENDNVIISNEAVTHQTFSYENAGLTPQIDSTLDLVSEHDASTATESDGNENHVTSTNVKTTIDLNKLISTSYDDLVSEEEISNTGRTSIDVNRFLMAYSDYNLEDTEVLATKSSKNLTISDDALSSKSSSETSHTKVTLISASSKLHENASKTSISQTKLEDSAVAVKELNLKDSSEIIDPDVSHTSFSLTTTSSHTEQTSIDICRFATTSSDDDLLRSIPETPSLQMEEDAPAVYSDLKAEGGATSKDISLDYTLSLSSETELTSKTSIDIGRLVSANSCETDEELVSMETHEESKMIGSSSSSMAEILNASSTESSCTKYTSININRLISSSKDNLFESIEPEISALQIEEYTNANLEVCCTDESKDNLIESIEPEISASQIEEYTKANLEVCYTDKSKDNLIESIEPEISALQIEEYTNANLEVCYTDESKDNLIESIEPEISALQIEEYTNANLEVCYTDESKDNLIESIEPEISALQIEEYTNANLEVCCTDESNFVDETLPKIFDSVIESDAPCLETEEYTNASLDIQNTDERKIEEETVKISEEIPQFSYLEIEEHTSANPGMQDTYLNEKGAPLVEPSKFVNESESSYQEIEEYANIFLKIQNDIETKTTTQEKVVIETEFSVLKIEEYTNANTEIGKSFKCNIEEKTTSEKVTEKTRGEPGVPKPIDRNEFESSASGFTSVTQSRVNTEASNMTNSFYEEQTTVSESFSKTIEDEESLIEQLKSANYVKTKTEDLNEIKANNNAKTLTKTESTTSSELQAIDDSCYAMRKTSPSLMTPSGSSSDSDYVAIDNQSSIEALKADNLVASRTQDLLNRYVQNILSHKPEAAAESKHVEENGGENIEKEEDKPDLSGCKGLDVDKKVKERNEEDEGENEEDCEPVSIEMRREALLRQHEKDIASTVSQKRLSSAELLDKKIVATKKETFLSLAESDSMSEKHQISLKREIVFTNEEETYEKVSQQAEKSNTVSAWKEVHNESDVAERSVHSPTNGEELGSQMNRYIALTKGEAVQHSSDEEDDEKDGAVDESLYTDQQGVKIERSGGKIEIVKSSEGISNLKNRFGGKSQWKKTDAVETSSEVDSTNVKSAFSVFKSQENKKEEQPQRNRPKSKKVRDPKELMELRKKATYGNEEELPQDGVIKKSVDVDQEALDTTIKHHALNVYKNLEKREDTLGPVNKPKTKLLSDVEAQATLEGIRSISSSTSEASDVNETVNDLTVDTVSGYGSAAPCSPSSVLSEDYLSDHKDETNRNELKDAALNIEVEAKLTINNTDDVTLIKCQEEITTVEVPAEAPVELVGV